MGVSLATVLYCMDVIISTTEYNTFFLDPANNEYYTPINILSENEFWFKPKNECSQKLKDDSRLKVWYSKDAWNGAWNTGHDFITITHNGEEMKKGKWITFKDGDTFEITYELLKQPLKIKYSKCQKNYKELETKIHKWGVRLNKTREETDKLQDSLNETNNYLQTVNQRWMAFQNDTDVELEALKRIVNTISSNSSSLISNWTHEFIIVNEKYDDLNLELNSTLNMTETFKNDLNFTQVMTKTLRNELNVTKENVKELEAHLDTSKEILAQVRRELNATQDKVEKLRDDLNKTNYYFESEKGRSLDSKMNHTHEFLRLKHNNHKINNELNEIKLFINHTRERTKHNQTLNNTAMRFTMNYASNFTTIFKTFSEKQDRFQLKVYVVISACIAFFGFVTLILAYSQYKLRRLCIKQQQFTMSNILNDMVNI